MARTPLMRALQRMASEHTEASEKGISVEEVRHLRRATISRRDLLKGAGALAAGLALTGGLTPRRSPGSSKGPGETHPLSAHAADETAVE